MKTLQRAFAPEEHSDGNKPKEVEREIIVRLIDISELDKAEKSEFHEQWEIKVPQTENNVTSVRSRIRKTTVSLTEAPVYVHTTKTKSESQSYNDEVSIPTTEPHFKQYQAGAETGMIKERFFFPVNTEQESSGLIWELDMYPIDPDNPFERKYKQWARLEIENVEEGMALPDLPIAVDEVIIIGPDNTPEEKEKIDFIFKNEFLYPNRFKTK